MAKIQKTVTSVRRMSNRNVHILLLAGEYAHITTLEDPFAAEHTHTLWLQYIQQKSVYHPQPPAKKGGKVHKYSQQAPLLLTSKKVKRTYMSITSGMDKLWLIHQNTVRQQEWMNGCCYMQQHGWTSQAQCWVKRRQNTLHYSFNVNFQKQAKQIYGGIIRIVVTFGKEGFWDAGDTLFSWSEC